MSILNWLLGSPSEELVDYTASYEDEEVNTVATVGGHDPDSQRSLVQAIKKFEETDTGRTPEKITINSRTPLN